MFQQQQWGRGSMGCARAIAHRFTLASLMILQACGGGGESGSGGEPAHTTAQPPDATIQVTASAPTPTTNNARTLASYAATRASTANASTTTSTSAATTVTAGAAEPGALATWDLAVDALTQQSATVNAMAVPPLTLAHLNTLLAAARGDTLTKLQTQFPLAQTLNDWARSQLSVQRQLWTPAGKTLTLDFLTQTDLGGADRWQGHEADWASPSTDAALTQALTAAHSHLSARQLDAQDQLLLLDSLSIHLAWSQAESLPGRFQLEDASQRQLSIVRITQGVTRFDGNGYTAEAWTQATNGVTVMKLVPLSGSLGTFLQTKQLGPALHASIQALLIQPGAAAIGGELLLPVDTVSAPTEADALTHTGAAAVAYDEVNANLQGLDTAGGTYAKVSSSPAVLSVDSSGLTLQAAAVTELIFSPRNLHQAPDTGASFVFDKSDSTLTYAAAPSVPLQDCSALPFLRSFFIVLLDRNHTVLALGAVTDLPGSGIRCL